jgi:molybdate transport system substrate-binding protein
MLVSSCFSFMATSPIGTGETYIAVAANFSDAMDSLTTKFGIENEDKITLVIGSTGKLFAQISNNAPFDAFFAADVKRPQLLEAQGIAIGGSRFTYAIGKLILWSPDPELIDSSGMVLKSADFRYLAMANPELAPYGAAAKSVLEKLGIWLALLPLLVQGENVNQAYQYVISGNAELGFVALSQVINLMKERTGSFWEVPENLYEPIEQQAVLLSDSPTAKVFFDFVKSEAGKDIIRSFGYAVPDTLTAR